MTKTTKIQLSFFLPKFPSFGVRSVGLFCSSQKKFLAELAELGQPGRQRTPSDRNLVLHYFPIYYRFLSLPTGGRQQIRCQKVSPEKQKKIARIFPLSVFHFWACFFLKNILKCQYCITLQGVISVTFGHFFSVWSGDSLELDKVAITNCVIGEWQQDMKLIFSLSIIFLKCAPCLVIYKMSHEM